MNYFKKKELKVILWRIGSEGKTTLLYRGLKKMNDFQKIIPTVGCNIETIYFNGINITFWDIGGAYKIKELRNYYLPSSDAIIFLIDSSESLEINNNYIFKNNFEEFNKCIKLIEDKLFLIAITKIDIRKTSTLDIINFFQLENLFKRKKKFGIIECSSFSSQGIKEILYWLSSITIINTNKK